jgi:hypothetical protein
MAVRPRSWCKPGQHHWKITTDLLMALPRPDGDKPILVVRACQRCPLAESMHAIQWPKKIGLRAYEFWSTQDRGKDWQENTALWNKFTEAKSFL